jgi:hypothetical protein
MSTLFKTRRPTLERNVREDNFVVCFWVIFVGMPFKDRADTVLAFHCLESRNATQRRQCGRESIVALKPSNLPINRRSDQITALRIAAKKKMKPMQNVFVYTATIPKWSLIIVVFLVLGWQNQVRTTTQYPLHLRPD